VWRRAVLDSQDADEAHWVGECGLPAGERADLLRRHAAHALQPAGGFSSRGSGESVMRTHVVFRSSRFPLYEGEEERANEALWGKSLAEYLAAKLPAEGVETGEIFHEHWGWELRIQNKRFKMTVWCGQNREHDDGFLCFIDPSTSVVRSWLRKIDTTEDVGRVAEALDRILTSDPEIRDVQWRDPEDLLAGWR
jgi:hypothetical protein